MSEQKKEKWPEPQDDTTVIDGFLVEHRCYCMEEAEVLEEFVEAARYMCETYTGPWQTNAVLNLKDLLATLDEGRKGRA